MVVNPRSPPAPPTSISDNQVQVEAVVNMPVLSSSEETENISDTASITTPVVTVNSNVEENNITLSQAYMVTTTNVTYTITQSFAVPSQAKSSDIGMYSYQQHPSEGTKTQQARVQGPNTTLIYACTSMNAPLLVPSREQCTNLTCGCNPTISVPPPPVSMAPPVTIATPHHAPPATNMIWPHPLYTLPAHQGNLHNGLVNPPNIPLTHPIPGINLANGVTPLYNNHQANYSVIPTGIGHARPPGFVPHPAIPVRGIMPALPPMFHAGKPPKCKEPMCHNCGAAGHWAHECQEPTMDSITNSGIYMYKPYKAKKNQ